LRGADRTDTVTLSLLILAGFAIRLYLLQFHDVISNDGTAYVGAARAFMKGNLDPLSSYGFYPMLIGLISLPGLDPETVGRIISVTLGSFLAVPLYLLGKGLFSRRTALAACIATLVWPSLLNWSCEVMTQSTYNFLSLTGIYCLWKATSFRSLRWSSAAGVLLGLAYLTRPEGLLLFIVTPLPLLWSQRRHLPALWPPVALYVACFAGLFGLNVLLVHHVTGTWQLSAKTSAALLDALSYYLNIPDLAYIPNVKSLGYLDIITLHPAFLWENSSKNLLELWNSFIPVPLWVMVLIGFFTGGFSAERNYTRLLLLSMLSPLFVIVIFYYIGPEYTQQYLPFFFLFAAEGLLGIERFITLRIAAIPESLRSRWVDRAPLTLAATAVFALYLLVGQLPARDAFASYRSSDDGGRRDTKKIGQLLKEHLPPGKIMTRWARIAYYADREWVPIPNAGFESILQTARENGVRFLIVDGALLGVRPDLAVLSSGLDPEGPRQEFFVYKEGMAGNPGVHLYLRYLDPSSMGVKVFEIH
jgi:4-amino-4-deoxy-L-arabinose transferase-like glycosyltransferase